MSEATSDATNWRKILCAYISHVGAEEGIDFLPAPVPGLSPHELAALFEAAAETSLAPHANLLRERALHCRLGEEVSSTPERTSE